MVGLKKSWFGYVAQRKADLAATHDAVVVTEDLDILAVPTDEPAYKGRTFNKMINNGSKGQYILRSKNTLTWRGKSVGQDTELPHEQYRLEKWRGRQEHM